MDFFPEDTGARSQTDPGLFCFRNNKRRYLDQRKLGINNGNRWGKTEGRALLYKEN